MLVVAVAGLEADFDAWPFLDALVDMLNSRKAILIDIGGRFTGP